jgi:hypothetical protein
MRGEDQFMQSQIPIQNPMPIQNPIQNPIPEGWEQVWIHLRNPNGSLLGFTVIRVESFEHHHDEGIYPKYYI